ncbi:MAG: Tetratricopeptide 2 repeat protein [Verrucomicrobia bacterium]|jgi:hypothetical protein|nr:Tetratricopeptide 2 repeat protein [Verrucomicrobiota bacterium]
MKVAFLSVGLGALLLLTGCATTPKAARIPLTGDPLVDGRTHIEQGPPNERILWQYRTALVAMRRGDYPQAKALLDDAILTIGGILTNDKDARRARSMFASESRKKFIGEPYERVMAYYYRGILYWMDGEPDNARACFRSGELIDSDTEVDNYAADYVLLDYLDGFASDKLFTDGGDALKRAKANASTKMDVPPDYDRAANVLFFTECGFGPQKYATGQYREQLRFREGQQQARVVTIKLNNGQVIRTRPWDDLYFQATTRGGRVMDHILANKAVFKQSTDTVGDVAIVSGAVLATGRNTQEAGLGVLAFGLLSKAIAAGTTPAADVRAWDNLPQFLGFGALRVAPGTYTAQVEFQDGAGRLLANLSRRVTFEVKAADRDTVVYISDKQQ